MLLSHLVNHVLLKSQFTCIALLPFLFHSRLTLSLHHPSLTLTSWFRSCDGLGEWSLANWWYRKLLLINTMWSLPQQRQFNVPKIRWSSFLFPFYINLLLQDYCFTLCNSTVHYQWNSQIPHVVQSSKLF